LSKGVYSDSADHGRLNIMGMYWLLDRDGAKGPSILVEADGAMRVIDVLRFGPKVTKLEDQQKIWDDVVGGVVPTMKPFVIEADLEEEGVEVHADLEHGGAGGASGRRGGKARRKSSGGGRSAGGSKRTGGRGRG
jgi:hypothetical protein